MFRLDGIDPGTLRLEADGGTAGWAIGRAGRIGTRPVATFTLTLAPETSLAGTVHFANGTPAAGAIVTAVPAVGEMMQTRADGQGRFVLGPVAPEETLVCASIHAGDAALANVDLPSRYARIVMPAAGQQMGAIDLELPMNGTTSTSGVVVDATGLPLPGATVELSKHAGWLVQRGIAWTSTDEDGHFTIGHASSDDTFLRVTHPGFARSFTVLGPGLMRVVMTSAVSLGGVVRDDAGRPEARYQITALPLDQGRIGAVEAFVESTGGRFDLALAEGRYDLVASVPGERVALLANVVVERRARMPDLTLVTTSGVSISGTITHPNGRPRPGLAGIVHQEGVRRAALSDVAGRFSVSGLLPGRPVVVEIEPGQSPFLRSWRRVDAAAIDAAIEIGPIVVPDLRQSPRVDERPRFTSARFLY
jgi:hypothetical protein